MAKVPVRFQRTMAAAFHADVALSRLKRCSESSGSEHSPESSADLSDLVLSFMEENQRVDEVGVVLFDEDQENSGDEEVERFGEKREMLQKLFTGIDYEDDEKDAKERIRRAVELASGVFENHSIPEFKRMLMSRLQEKGFDAGLCKTKWEKNGKLAAGDYEYIDVNFSGTRYIVEVSLAAEFEIARPTNQFASLLDVFPMIFVGKVEDLKRIVRLMCTAIKGSMKRNDLHIPPWRRNAYMQAKWFSSYKRTTNAVSTRNALGVPLFPKRSVAFEKRPVKAYSCRDVYVGNSNTGFRIGHLAAAFNSDNFGL